jgi:hypothetical protein
MAVGRPTARRAARPCVPPTWGRQCPPRPETPGRGSYRPPPQALATLGFILAVFAAELWWIARA